MNILFRMSFAGFMFLNMNATYAQTQTISTDAINVDGYVTTKAPTDNEMESIKAEIKRQKLETVLNKEKAKNFKELSKSVGVLSETTEEYLLEKKEAQGQIAEYNLKVKCLRDEDTSKECEKYNKKKN